MKRIIPVIIGLIFLLSGCAGNAGDESSKGGESAAADAEKPVISITGGDIEIYVGAFADLASGVTGSDNVDGDITDKIMIDGGGFDCFAVGSYTVTYALTDSAGNSAETVTRVVNVSEDPSLPPIYDGIIEGEKPKPEAPRIYGGAWYHKVVSSKDSWVGIETTLTIPEFKIERYLSSYDSSLAADPSVQNLDNPSLYLGGNALYESDVGLSLSKVLLAPGTSSISVGSVAFRPFWRYITTTDKDAGGYDVHNGKYAVSANGNNCFANYHWSYTEYYYLPGDTVRMIITVPSPGKMQLTIKVLQKSTLESSLALRRRYGWKDPADFQSPVFSSPGHGTGAEAEFKRVNAIDQVGNEGGDAIAANTTVTGAVWHSTYLYRVIDGTLYRVPMTEQRSAVRNAPVESAFTVVTGENGSETVDIHPKA